LAAPWPRESWLGNDLSKMRQGLRARGLDASEIISTSERLDRERVAEQLAQVRRRIATWTGGSVLLFYSGHGMYRTGAGGVIEPGLQLNERRDDPASSLLWRELLDRLAPPPGVRVLVLPDCCHTNLLARRLPSNVTALIVKSEPQDALTCRTGTALFGEEPVRVRHGVISYYGGETVAAASTAQGWLDGIHAAAERDLARKRLDPRRRLTLMIEGDSAVSIPGRPAPASAGRALQP
jgi:hypothetical protein